LLSEAETGRPEDWRETRGLAKISGVVCILNSKPRSLEAGENI